MNLLTITKLITNFAISFGIGNIIGNVIKHHSPAKVNLVRKIAIGIGGFFLSSFITNKVSQHAEDEIDDVVDKFGKLKKSLKDLADKAKKQK